MAQPVRGHPGDQPRHRARLGVALIEGGYSPSAAPGRFASLRSVPAGRRCGAGAGGRWRLRPSQAGGEGPGLRPLRSALPRLLRAGGVGQLRDGGQRPGLRRYGSPGTPLQARPAPASFVGGREARIPGWDGVEGAGAAEVWGGGVRHRVLRERGAAVPGSGCRAREPWRLLGGSSRDKTCGFGAVYGSFGFR